MKIKFPWGSRPSKATISLQIKALFLKYIFMMYQKKTLKKREVKDGAQEKNQNI